jgi:hypothetical protein
MNCPDDRAAVDLGNILAAYVEFDVPEQAAAAIGADFYRDVMGIAATVDFSGPHRELNELSLIKEESDQQQYRVENILAPASGETVFTIEHEIRSLRHLLFMQLIVNRDPAQSNQNYAPGHDPFLWATPSD